MRKLAVPLLAAVLLANGSALAQGGPPLVTDDPETPADGRWEINVAAIYARSHDRKDLALPDVDMNYGYGGNIQLKLDIPWAFSKDGSEAWKSGLGAIDAGVKWRFIDQEKAGFSMSTYPQVLWNPLDSSARRGITSPDTEFLLPVEAATQVGGVGLDAEVGRNFVEHGSDQWVAGFIVAPKCSEDIECLFEVHETIAPHEHQTLLNIGMHWDLREGMTLLAAVGREFGTASDEQRKALVYLGVQFVR
jgi:hypothetical protein